MYTLLAARLEKKKQLKLIRKVKSASSFAAFSGHPHSGCSYISDLIPILWLLLLQDLWQILLSRMAEMDEWF